nr:hypothetical protein Iba_contig3919CG0010 [Ipomoea batatas]
MDLPKRHVSSVSLIRKHRCGEPSSADLRYEEEFAGFVQLRNAAGELNRRRSKWYLRDRRVRRWRGRRSLDLRLIGRDNGCLECCRKKQSSFCFLDDLCSLLHTKLLILLEVS